ncbi:ABC-type transport system, substrate-binding protein [Candidatus Phytoplasma solani]|uniref:ABC transporter substrate-binding protein n=1 Tax=Candidatus Phytoplasma solani TaxID=69896 RepID=UPI0032DADC28
MKFIKNIKIASPMQSVLNTLNKAKKKFQKDNINLEVIKVDYQNFEAFEMLLNEKIDGLIYTNIHVLNSVNSILKANNKEILEFVQPFYHSKYGLYINQKRNPTFTNLEDVKKHSRLKVLLATGFSYIGPCDIPRSLILLNNLGLIKISQETLRKKKFDLSLSDIQNIYQLEFFKNSQIPEKFLNHPEKYDLMANWPAFMNPYADFKRIGSNIEGNEEPTDDFVISYAIGLACKKSHKDNEKTKLIQTILNHTQTKEFHFQEGGKNKDYIMLQNPEKTGQRIKQLWLKT